MILPLKRRTVFLLIGALIFFGLLAYCASRLDVPNVQRDASVFTGHVGELFEPFTDPNKVKQLAQFEVHFIEAEKFAVEKNYPDAHKEFTEAMEDVVPCFRKKSFFVALMYLSVGVFEKNFKHWTEAEKAFTAALGRLPDKDANLERWFAQRDLMNVFRAERKWAECATLSREHLGLTESLVSTKDLDHTDLVGALSALAIDLNNAQESDESVQIWQRYLAEARAVRDQDVDYENCVFGLLAIAVHDARFNQDADANKHLAEARKIAQDQHSDGLMASVDETKANLLARRNDLDGAERALNEAIVLRKKVNDEWAYTYCLLSKVVRRRGDLTERQAALTQSLALTAKSDRSAVLKDLIVVSALRNHPSDVDRYVFQLIPLEKKVASSGFWIYADDVKRLTSMSSAAHARDAKTIAVASLKKDEDPFGGATELYVSRHQFEVLIDSALHRSSH
jgi:tetratricopeptide (TPR) repeat protein